MRHVAAIAISNGPIRLATGAPETNFPRNNPGKIKRFFVQWSGRAIATYSRKPARAFPEGCSTLAWFLISASENMLHFLRNITWRESRKFTRTVQFRTDLGKRNLKIGGR